MRVGSTLIVCNWLLVSHLHMCVCDWFRFLCLCCTCVVCLSLSFRKSSNVRGTHRSSSRPLLWTRTHQFRLCIKNLSISLNRYQFVVCEIVGASSYVLSKIPQNATSKSRNLIYSAMSFILLPWVCGSVTPTHHCSEVVRKSIFRDSSKVCKVYAIPHVVRREQLFSSSL